MPIVNRTPHVKDRTEGLKEKASSISQKQGRSQQKTTDRFGHQREAHGVVATGWSSSVRLIQPWWVVLDDPPRKSGRDSSR
jgi:hypothetical protein